MKTRSALVAAIGCGAAAVVLVGADLAFNVDAVLEVRTEGGSWKTVSELGSGSERPYATPIASCGSHFRLTLHNGLPWGTSTDVSITAFGLGDTRILLDQTWHLGAGESKSHEFQVPSETLEGPSRPGDAPVKQSGSVEVMLDRDYARQLYASACEGEAA